jgi:hypothetical protein
MASNANKILTFPSSLVLDIINIGRGRSREALEVRGGKRSEGERCLRMSLSPSGGEEAMLGGLPLDRGRGNNGRIMEGRGPGIDGWRKRWWGREDCGCCAFNLCHGDKVKSESGC